MRETLIVVGLFVMAVAFRSARTAGLRKLGAFTFLGACFCMLYFLTGSIVAGWSGAAVWLFLPWIELLTRIRRMRLPIDNRLTQRSIPNPSFFPNAPEAAAAMEEAGGPANDAQLEVWLLHIANRDRRSLRRLVIGQPRAWNVLALPPPLSLPPRHGWSGPLYVPFGIR